MRFPLDQFQRFTGRDRPPACHHGPLQPWRNRLGLWGLALGILLGGVPTLSGISPAQTPQTLAPLRSHPLPPALAQIPDGPQDSSYFSAITPSPLGYLIWSRFPLKIYVAPIPPDLDPTAASYQRFFQWRSVVAQALAEWQPWFSQVMVTEPHDADIRIERSHPPIKVTRDPNTGELHIPPAPTARTYYEFYLTGDGHLAHRMAIEISPNETGGSLLATVRHELGHALGIWGHSNHPEDALYPSQVAAPPPISPRDLHTLKQLYQQPTQLGWPVSP